MVNTSPQVHHKLIKRAGCLCAIHIITTFDHHEIFGYQLPETETQKCGYRNTEICFRRVNIYSLPQKLLY